MSIKTNMHQTLCQGLYGLVYVGGSTNQVLPYLMSLRYAHKCLHSPRSKGKGSNTTSTNTCSFRGMDLTTQLVMRQGLVKVSVIYHIQLIQLENHKHNLLGGMCGKNKGDRNRSHILTRHHSQLALSRLFSAIAPGGRRNKLCSVAVS